MVQESLLPDEPSSRPHRDRALASLAYINVTWEHDRTSYLDNFVPFVLEVLRAAAKPLTPEDVTADVQDQFGLDFPVNVVRSLINRGVKRRHVRRISRSSAVELADGIATTLPDIAAQQRECSRRQSSLVKSLVAFAGEHYSLTWDEAKAETALFEFIEAHVIPLLRSTTQGGTRIGFSDPKQGPGYVVATFIADITKSDPQGFEYLDEIVKGSMLAAALYVDTSGQVVSRKFRRTTIYLDTSVCLRVLGHEGPQAQEAARSLVDLAHDQKAEVACFEHTVTEMRGVLAGAGEALRRSPGSETGTRGVVAHYRDIGGTPADIEMALATLDRDLRRNQIRVRPAPDYTMVLGVDEKALEEVLQNHVGYFRQPALLHDLKCLTAIHRLRDGHSEPHVEECRAVFVTNNTGLVRASRTFFDAGDHGWPLTMDDAGLATLLWVKAPTVSPNLPRQQVIADSFAAMSPSHSLWSKVSDEVERLSQKDTVDEEDIALLRYSREAQRAVMDATLGDPLRVTEKAIQEALSNARQKVVAPAAEERDAALARADELEKADTESRFDAEAQKAENEDMRRTLRNFERRIARSEEYIRGQVTRRYARIAFAAKLLAWLVVVGSVVVTVVSLVPETRERLPGSPWLWTTAAVVAACLSGVTLMRGGSVVEWINNIRDSAIEKALANVDILEGD